MAVSKRLRFEVLKRDNHTCRYCGAKGEDSPLTIDHVVPVALGGSDDPSNLVAACKDCNAGKSSVPADAPLVQGVADKAFVWAEAMRIVAEERAEQRSRSRKYYAAFRDEWDSWTDRGGNTVPVGPAWKATIDQLLNAGLDMDDLLELIDVAMSAKARETWKYFCGCCWKRLTQIQERAAEIASMPIDPFAETVTHLTTRWSQPEIDEFLTDTVKLVNEKTGRDISVADLTCEHGDSCDDVLCQICCASALSAFFHTPEELSG